MFSFDNSGKNIRWIEINLTSEVSARHHQAGDALVGRFRKRTQMSKEKA